ncbi:MAG: peptidoglycan-binding protein, partial [Actinomycetota bacterium]|nr:peptidoglycan-binding protein [Actinomycetota bacterium]
SATVIQRGDVRAEVSVSVGVPVSVDGDAVVTQILTSASDAVVEGSRVVEVSGRPVFVLQGDVPVFRTLRPGMSGADVVQLQEALTRLGFGPDRDGLFGEATKSAVSALYEASGYTPIPASLTAGIDLVAARQALEDADAAVVTAFLALGKAGEGQPGSVVAQAEASFNEAVRARDAALAAQVSDVLLAEQENHAAVTARDRIAADPDASPADVDAASLDAERAGVHLEETVRTSQNAVDAARESLRVASLALEEARTAGDADGAKVALDAAVAGRDRAQAAMDALLAANGPTVAQGEVVFVPSMPARVLSAVTSLGAAAAGDDESGSVGDGGAAGLVELAGGGLVVSTVVRPGDVGLVRSGMMVELLDETTGTVYSAAIAELAAEPSMGPDGQVGYPATIRADRPLPDGLTGSNVRVTITAASTETEALVVPLAAVSSAADGTTRVSVVDGPNGTPVDVPVEVGLSADGFVVVEASVTGAVGEGDLVVVGR